MKPDLHPTSLLNPLIRTSAHKAERTLIFHLLLPSLQLNIFISKVTRRFIIHWDATNTRQMGRKLGKVFGKMENVYHFT